MAMYETLAEKVGTVLRDRAWTISAAESCTGGLFMSTLTDTPGSSDYVVGGIVTYSNETKRQFVHVSLETLEAYGAVSAPTARQMATGARALFRTSLAISITGIAGPGGGTTEKPVGLVYIGLDNGSTVRVERFVWDGDRDANKRHSVKAALEMVLQAASEQEA
jgi:PncC family amidohydrolase